VLFRSLTDGQGRVVDFRNAIIIMTSNIGSEFILTMKSMDEVRSRIDDLLKSYFKPEFLNRIDEIVVFDRLDESMIRRITELRLNELAGRLSQRNIALTVDDAAKDYIAKEGFDQQFGARPLKRAIQNLLENPIAKKLLAGQVLEGDTVHVSMSGDELVISAERTA
jgi:ATP-dependent Clp protease ATP-binding subunit ClpB